MAYEVELRNVPERYAAVDRFHAKLPEFGEKMPAAYGKVMSLLGRRSIPVRGPAMGRFRPTAEAEFDVEAGSYVEAVADSGDGVDFILIRRWRGRRRNAHRPGRRATSGLRGDRGVGEEAGLRTRGDNVRGLLVRPGVDTFVPMADGRYLAPEAAHVKPVSTLFEGSE